MPTTYTWPTIQQKCFLCGPRHARCGQRANRHAFWQHKRCFLCGPCWDCLLGKWVVTHLYNNMGSSVFCNVWSMPWQYKRDSLIEGAEPRERGYSEVQQSIPETRELELGVQKLYNKVREWKLSQSQNKIKNRASLRQSLIVSCYNWL
jgi:hypothetical protein